MLYQVLSPFPILKVQGLGIPRRRSNTLHYNFRPHLSNVLAVWYCCPILFVHANSTRSCLCHHVAIMTDSITRLHISPLTPDLLSAVLGANLTKVAQNISYHSLQTFPDQPYGYLDLPTMDAEKVKKKLNGAILKGKKVKVEEARPKKRSHSDTIEQDSPAPEEVAPRQSKRTKKDSNVLPAYEISPDRKVKRGWTEAKTEKTKTKTKKKKDKEKSSTKTQAPSKYTEKEELLFKTKLPPNKKSTKAKDGKKEKKDKSGADIVHEFKHNTTVPSFLRDSKTSDSNSAVEYKDGQGWVDQNGGVVEEESSKALRKRKAAKLGLEIDVNKAQQLENQRKVKKPISPPDKHTSSESISSSEESSDEESDGEKETKTAITDADETSSSGTSSPSVSSDSESDSPSDEEENEDMATPAINKTATPPPTQQIHPLEALFKKPNVPSSTQPQPSTSTSKNSETIKPTLELNTTFSFFEQGPSDSENEIEVTNTLPAMPMTPFTSQDFRSRTMRSAAPTPDTADPRKSKGYASFMLGLGSEDSTDSEDELSEPELESNHENVHQTKDNKDRDSTTPIPSQSQLQSQSNLPLPLSLPQSEFEKRFWESRGENNRAWKSRRRTVLKEKRQRENRARRPKTW